MNGWTKAVYAKAHLIPRDRQNDLDNYLKEFKEQWLTSTEKN
jgi:hypothetical protein